MLATAVVLVELFTSQGCSSCPPADAVLARLAGEPHVIVLSEHVDYWDYLGWKDPYSSAQFSERQGAYARRFVLRGPYTPQMVVDGQYEFVGSDEGQARRTIARAGKTKKIDITSRSGEGRLHIAAPAGSNGELWIAEVRREGSALATRGENAGRHLRHVAIVKRLTRANGMEAHMPEPPAGTDVVAFVQERGLGRVLGAARWAGR